MLSSSEEKEKNKHRPTKADVDLLGNSQCRQGTVQPVKTSVRRERDMSLYPGEMTAEE